jgi:gliding motility-associated-like protein
MLSSIRFYFSILSGLLAFNPSVVAQLNIVSAQQSSNWADYYVQEVLLGTGVTAFNVTFSGCDTTGGNEGLDSLQIGEFTSTNTLVDIPYGLMLHTGSVENFSGGANFGDGVSDIDLDSLLPGFTMNNAAILEFDFVPQGDTVRFNYVFGSLEYPTYVCSPFNDVFGFFLSGPGINGNFENNGENIALVPGTNIPVSINTINDVAGGSSCTQPCPCNSQYYVNNNGFANDTNVRFTGMTVTLEAKHWVNCGDTYHIKLAIADAGDGVLNSGVFLEGGSFTSNLIEVNIASVNGDSTINEGCGSAEILFTRGDTTDTSITYIQFLGTATNGVDCDTIPDTIILLPGVFDTTIVISPYFDNIVEGVEVLIIQAISVTLCNDTFISEGRLYFHDIPDLNLLTTDDTTFDCPVDSLTISSVVTGGGPPPYAYMWNTGDTGSTITVPISSGFGVDTFAVEVWDSCALFSNVDTVFVTRNYQDDPIADIINDTTVNCVGDSLELLANVIHGNSPFTYSWSTGDTVESTIVVVTGQQQLTVTITDICGRVSVDTALVSVKSAEDFIVLVPDSLIYCAGSPFSFNVKAVGSAGPYSYAWTESNPIFGDTNGLSITVNQDTTMWVWARDICGRLTSASFFIDAIVTEPLTSSLIDQEGECSGDEFEFDPMVSGGLPPYSFQWSSNDSDSVVLLPINITQNVSVTITDVCGNVTFDNSLVTIAKLEPMSISVSGDNELCFGAEYIMSLLTYGGAGDYQFEWTYEEDPILGENFVQLSDGEYRIVSFKNNSHYFKAIDKCGNTIQDTVSIQVKHCLEIPNVVTPNGDGINDAFYIGNVLNFPDARLTVYNRWGIKVFDSKPYLNEWVPIDLSAGVYYYILTSEYFPQLRGDITILKE